MKTLEQTARQIFGERAAMYTSSAAHTDPQILAEVVRLAAPQADWSALDVATGTGHTAFALAPHVARVNQQSLLDKGRSGTCAEYRTAIEYTTWTHIPLA